MIKKIYMNTLEPKEILSRLSKGEEIHYVVDSDHFIYRIEEGIFCRFKAGTNEILIRPALLSNDEERYFEEEADLISEPGLYRTQLDKKVFVSDIIEHAGVCHGIIEGTCKATTWYLNGQRHKTYLTDDDIVDVWKDDND